MMAAFGRYKLQKKENPLNTKILKKMMFRKALPNKGQRCHGPDTADDNVAFWLVNGAVVPQGPLPDVGCRSLPTPLGGRAWSRHY